MQRNGVLPPRCVGDGGGALHDGQSKTQMSLSLWALLRRPAASFCEHQSLEGGRWTRKAINNSTPTVIFGEGDMMKK
jgi:hypothetical protein